MASGTKDIRGTGMTPGPGTSPTISVLVPLVTDTSTGNPVRFTMTVVDRMVQILPASPAVTSQATAELPPDGNDTLYVCKGHATAHSRGNRGEKKRAQKAGCEKMQIAVMAPGRGERSLRHCKIVATIADTYLATELVHGQVRKGRHSHIHPHQQSPEHRCGLRGGAHLVPVPK